MLRQEHEAITGKDAGVLESLAQSKLEQVSDLETVNGERESLLLETGYDRDRRGIESFVRDHDNATGGRLSRLWAEVVALTPQCEQQNRINGAVVRQAHANVQRALGILQGHTGETDLYGPSGRAHKKQYSRNLVKA